MDSRIKKEQRGEFSKILIDGLNLSQVTNLKLLKIVQCFTSVSNLHICTFGT